MQKFLIDGGVGWIGKSLSLGISLLSLSTIYSVSACACSSLAFSYDLLSMYVCLALRFLQ